MTSLKMYNHNIIVLLALVEFAPNFSKSCLAPNMWPHSSVGSGTQPVSASMSAISLMQFTCEDQFITCYNPQVKHDLFRILFLKRQLFVCYACFLGSVFIACLSGMWWLMTWKEIFSFRYWSK